MHVDSERLHKISNFYNLEASGYDEGYSSSVCEAEDIIVSNIFKKIVRGKVLDIGSGSGLFCKMLDNIDEYVGVEISSEMTKLAKNKYPKKDFIISDMHNLPFASQSFDTIVSLYGPLSYSLNSTELLSEIVRVTRPGGYIALMPYTLRVEHKLEIGGYSTAIEDNIEKKYYSSQQMFNLLSCLEDTKVIGVNYFLNTYMRFLKELNIEKDRNIDLVEFLEKEQIFQSILPAELARHMIGIGRKPY